MIQAAKKLLFLEIRFMRKRNHSNLAVFKTDFYRFQRTLCQAVYTYKKKNELDFVRVIQI